MKTLITTSWDDGHPQDMRLAELLDKYNIPGTFYIPQSNAEHEVMSEAHIKTLAQRFEIGGHTLHHVRLHSTNEAFLEEEIKGCYDWLGRLLGSYPVSFCFPGGVYNSATVAYALKAGFKMVRTTELLNPSLPLSDKIFPTTVQLYNHSGVTYINHLLRRRKIRSLGTFLKLGINNRLEALADNYVEEAVTKGGCFHLWGHSWEIEEFGLWNQLEAILKNISRIPEAHYVTNAELINYQ